MNKTAVMTTRNSLRASFFKKLLLLFVFVQTSNLVFCQSNVPSEEAEVIEETKELNTTSEVDVCVATIANKNEVHSRGIGYAGITTEVYKAYTKLQKIATEKELFELLEHESPAVRVYAFKALEIKRSDLLSAARKKLANDNEKVMSYSGCIGSMYSVHILITSGTRL